MASQNGVSIGLRINPEFSDSPYDIYNPCKPGSRLGMTAEQLGDTLPQGVEGLHFHVLSRPIHLHLKKCWPFF